MSLVACIDPGKILVIVGSGQAEVSASFDSLDALKKWQPTFNVKYVQIFDNATPKEPEARWTIRNDETHICDNDGQLTISSPTITGAIAAYNWAYGLK